MTNNICTICYDKYAANKYAYCREAGGRTDAGDVDRGRYSDEGGGGEGVKRSLNGGVEHGESDSDDCSSDSEDEEGVDGELWPQ